MEYYVMFGATNDPEVTVVTFGTKGEVVDFIEEKVNEHNYKLKKFFPNTLSLSDFKVIYGTKLSLETEYVPVRIFIKNPS